MSDRPLQSRSTARSANEFMDDYCHHVPSPNWGAPCADYHTISLPPGKPVGLWAHLNCSESVRSSSKMDNNPMADEPRRTIPRHTNRVTCGASVGPPRAGWVN